MNDENSSSLALKSEKSLTTSYKTRQHLSSSEESATFEDDSGDEFVQNYRHCRSVYKKTRHQIQQYNNEKEIAEAKETKKPGISFISIHRRKTKEKVTIIDNEYIRFISEHDSAVQVVILLPLVLMTLYIILVEEGELFRIKIFGQES